MKLDWDDAKRQATLKDRGLDFADVVEIDWARALTLEDVRQPYPETRFITYAPIRDRLCVIAWCYRGEYLRVISLRKANKRERNRYGCAKTVYW